MRGAKQGESSEKTDTSSNLVGRVTEIEAEVKVAQLCLTLCDPMDYTVHGIVQARVLE